MGGIDIASGTEFPVTTDRTINVSCQCSYQVDVQIENEYACSVTNDDQVVVHGGIFALEITATSDDCEVVESSETPGDLTITSDLIITIKC